MAFFGLTQLGYQDTIREHVIETGTTPQHVFRSGLYRESPYRQVLTETNAVEKSSAVCSESEQKPVYTTGYNGSNVSYHDLQRSIELQKYHHDPAKVYRRPVTTSGEIGSWTRDEPLKEKEPWTHVKRHVLVNSEMTRFVNEMGLTNRDFSLFNC